MSDFLIRPATRFGKLCVIGRVAGRSMWLCRCDCGKEKAIRSDHLKSGATTSCGCLVDSMLKNGLRTVHGESKRSGRSVEWLRWSAMISRCYKAYSGECYKRYGARGIKVCDRWLKSFPAFLEDMGRCPAGFTIERINNDGHYSPDNCKWATRQEQANNRRTNHLIRFNGETLTASEWERRTGIKSLTLIARLRRGWTEQRTVSTPLL